MMKRLTTEEKYQILLKLVREIAKEDNWERTLYEGDYFEGCRGDLSDYCSDILAEVGEPHD